MSHTESPSCVDIIECPFVLLYCLHLHFEVTEIFIFFGSSVCTARKLRSFFKFLWVADELERIRNHMLVDEPKSYLIFCLESPRKNARNVSEYKYFPGHIQTDHFTNTDL